MRSAPVAATSTRGVHVLAITVAGAVVHFLYGRDLSSPRVSELDAPSHLKHLAAAVADSDTLVLYAVDEDGALWTTSMREQTKDDWWWLGRW
jgi:hypothetical protein